MVRSLGELDARPLAGTEGARGPFLSPDGPWVGFFLEQQLAKVAIPVGSPIAVCRFDGVPRGASWGTTNTIVFATSVTGTGLFTVPAGGDEPKAR
jgi:hypothetical protein